MLQVVVHVEKENLDVEMTLDVKQQCPVKPSVLLMEAAAGVFGEKHVWTANCGNVILPLGGLVVRPASKTNCLISS